ncbi:unnamed protein product [Albugo candida]|uniref:Uncharacterized protein n=1 Tax=Albugo candida TaxID=65357 RepID=A0A024GLQ2_9STRA|nr:unnamed protein product [Albugo candida]|eukprot:CCI47666.1 unnamed protein product [Albugo candida]
MDKHMAAIRIAIFYRRMRTRKDLQLRRLARQTIERLSRKQTLERFESNNSRQHERISIRLLAATLQLQRWARQVLATKRDISRNMTEIVWSAGDSMLIKEQMSCWLNEAEKKLHEVEKRETSYQEIALTQTLQLETINTRIARIEKQVVDLEYSQKSTSDDFERRITVLEEVVGKLQSYISEQPQEVARTNERITSLDKKIVCLEGMLNKIAINATAKSMAPSTTTQTLLPRLPMKPTRLRLPEARNTSLRR